MLGRLLTEQILQSVKYDTDHTVFSFIPNTAEIAYYGMMEGLEEYLNFGKYPGRFLWKNKYVQTNMA